MGDSRQDKGLWEEKDAMYEVGLIGCGNMGSAILKAVAKALKPEELLLANRTEQKAKDLAETLGCSYGSNAEVAGVCRYIFLGVKPGGMEEMLAPLKGILKMRDDFILVTMAAGLSIAKIKQMAGGDYPVIRIMPNTPVSIGKGMILSSASPEVGEEDRKEFSRLMKDCGCLDEIPENLMDAGCALSGCGPAYVDLFIEAMADAGEKCGLPGEKSLSYACQTLIGAASLVLESGKSPGALKEAVCSPGGSTIEGVHVLENRDFRGAVMDAVQAAYDKTVRMNS